MQYKVGLCHTRTKQKNVVLYGPLRTEGQGRKAESESINDWPKRSMIRPCVKNTEDLASFESALATCFHPSSIQPSAAQSSLPSWFGTENRACYVIIDRTCIHNFLSITRSCSEPHKFHGLQHCWNNVVMECFARFSRFQFLR